MQINTQPAKTSNKSLFNALLRKSHTIFCASSLLASAAAADMPIVFDFSPEIKRLPFPPALMSASNHPTLALYAQKNQILPQERWLEVLFNLNLPDLQPEEVVLQVQLYALADGRQLAEENVIPAVCRGALNLNLRQTQNSDFRLRVELHHHADLLDAKELLLKAQASLPLPTNWKIPVKLDFPAGVENVKDYPVTFGVPFPAGMLWDAKILSLTDAAGSPLPFQAEPTGFWARDGAIKWVRFDALVKTDTECFVTLAKHAASDETPPLTLTESKGQIKVDTGKAFYILQPGTSPIQAIQIDGQTVADAQNQRGLYVIDQNDRLASAAKDNSMLVEAAGPVAACIKTEGFYRTAEGEPLAYHITRLEFFAGRAETRVTHTLILTLDSNETWFKEIGWELGLNPGEQPKAVFNTDREKAGLTLETPLTTDSSAWMFQRDYIQYLGGTQVFEIAKADLSSPPETLYAGTDMGDWAAASGTDGGLLILCREAARQHPKEIELTPQKVILRLFSPRAGAELDFRSPASVARWNRGGILDRSPVVDLEHTAQLPGNAQGWSKTHELLFQPLAGTDKLDLKPVIETAACYSEQIFAHVDPNWIYASKVLGPLYPKNPARFPLIESFIEEAFEPYILNGHSILQEYGFIDYYAGPHYRGVASPGSPRYQLAYAVRTAAWSLYARAGERRLREFAQSTNRRYLDNQIAHWDTDKKTKGLYLSTIGENKDYGYLPFHWEQITSPYGGGGPGGISQFTLDYHLTGYRRAGDAAKNYAAGVKKWWEPNKPVWYHLKFLRNVTLAYSETWDRELIPIIEDILSKIYDPHGALGIERDGMPHGGLTTYKCEEDLSCLIQAAQITSDPRLETMARRVAEWAVYRSYGKDPLNTRYEKGNAANYLFDLTGDLSIVEDAARALREAAAGSPKSGISYASPRLLGLPALLGLVAEHDADRQPVASWLHYQELDTPTCILTRKPDIRAIVNFRLQGSDNVNVQIISQDTRLIGIFYTYSWANGVFFLNIPRDAGNTKAFKGPFDFLISADGTTERYLVADSRVPLVVYAPGAWLPLPKPQLPATKIFFEITPENTDPKICFEKPVNLFDPTGKQWTTALSETGWISLPADKPGIWNFELTEPGSVEGKGFPPFYAFGDPEFFFIPSDAKNILEPAATSQENKI